MFRLTWDTCRPVSIFAYGAITLLGSAFQKYSANLHRAMFRSRNPTRQAGWFRLFRFRSPLLTESLSISFPPGTEMFHFPGYSFLFLCIQNRMFHLQWNGFPHSEIPGSKRVVRSPRLIAVLPRPSSPVSAKAFTLRP